MSNFNYYKSKEIYREKYYQMPKVFFTSNSYKNLSNDAKIAYMLLKDRFDYSVKNNWVDKDDNVYFIFTVSELMALLNCREGKINKIKKELESVNLLRQERNWIKTNSGKLEATPNKLFLAKPNVTSEDVFRIQENESSKQSAINAKIAIMEKDCETNDSTTNAKIAIMEKDNSTNTSAINAKIANNLLDNNLDSNRHLIDTEKDELQNQILLDNFVDSCHNSQVPTFIPDNVLQLIATFSPNYESARQTVKTIHNAKYKAQEQTGITIVFEELEQQGVAAETELYQTLLKAYQKNKTEKVKDIQNLIFVYVRNWFIEKPIALIQQDQSEESLPDVSIDSWL